MPRSRGKKFRRAGPPVRNSNLDKKTENNVKKNRKTSKANVSSTSIAGLSSSSNANPPPSTSIAIGDSSTHALTATSSKALLKEKEEIENGGQISDVKKDKESVKQTYEGRRKDEKTRKQISKGNNKDKESGERISGFIFMCSAKTKPECYQHRVFGLPIGKKDVVEKIKFGAKLFLYDFDVKLLYGIYKASSDGRLNLERNAFRGNFPAQVRFKVYKDCLPLPESSFRHAIKENYDGRSKFRQELNSKQVRALTSLFRPITLQSHTSRPPRPSHSSPPARPSLEESYLPGIRHIHHLPAIGSQSEHIVPQYDRYGLETHIRHVQPSGDPRHVIQEGSRLRYTDLSYFSGAHQEYIPEEVLLSAQDPYRRYGVAADMVSREQIVGYQSEYRTLQVPRGREIHSENADRYHLPPARSGYELPSAYAQRELALAEQTYYPLQSRAYADPLLRSDTRGPGLEEANLPSSSRYSYAGAPPPRR